MAQPKLMIPEVRVPTRTIDDRVLIVLNTNARRVNEQKIYEVLDAFHNDSHVDVVTTTEKDSIQRIRDHILEDKYGAVVCGGGDGTVIGIVNALVNEDPEGMLFPGITSPVIVPTRLGTGGAYSRTVGGTKDLVLDTHLVLEVEDFSKLPLTQFPLMEITTTNLKGNTETHYGTFAGQGWDAQILVEYEKLKAKGIQGFSGYCHAINTLFKSIFWNNDHYKGHISFPNKSEIVRFNKRGDDELYRGDNVKSKVHYPSINSVIAGTSKQLGYGMTGFPLAEEAAQDNKFHLRVICGNPRSSAFDLMFCHPLRSYKGKHFPMYCHEHITDHAIITVPQGQEFQNGGDAQGKVIRTEYLMSPMKLGLVNLTELREKLSSR